MAKKSSVEKNNRRQRMTKNAAEKRAKLKAIISDKNKPMEERFRCDHQARRDAAQFVGDPHSQPLRSQRPSSRGLSQEQDEPHCAP